MTRLFLFFVATLSLVACLGQSIEPPPQSTNPPTPDGGSSSAQGGSSNTGSSSSSPEPQGGSSDAPGAPGSAVAAILEAAGSGGEAGSTSPPITASAGSGSSTETTGSGGEAGNAGAPIAGAGAGGSPACLHPSPDPNAPPIYTTIDVCDCQRAGYDRFEPVGSKPEGFCVWQQPDLGYCCLDAPTTPATECQPFEVDTAPAYVRRGITCTSGLACNGVPSVASCRFLGPSFLDTPPYNGPGDVWCCDAP